MANDISISGKC